MSSGIGLEIKNEPNDNNETNEFIGNEYSKTVMPFGHSSPYFPYLQSQSSFEINKDIKSEVGLSLAHGFNQGLFGPNTNMPSNLNFNYANFIQAHGTQQMYTDGNSISNGTLNDLYWPPQVSSSEYFPKQHPSQCGKSIKGSQESSKSCKNVKQKSPKGSSPRKKIDRFNGVAEEEVAKKLLPDHVDHNLDIIIIGINPGLFAAHVGHHYAGPGNHFWKCLFLSGLIPEPFSAYEDFKLLQYGIGFTNMVARTTRGSADLSRKEIAEGGEILLSKLKYYQPKVAVFNGKGIYEVFSKRKDFSFGKQPEKIEGTNTHIWVMPSSSARCAQLPRAIDKVPFYLALKKLIDNLKGLLPDLKEEEVVFTDLKLKNFKKEPKKECKVES